MSDRRIRVMLLLPSLHGGGAERVAVQLINRMDPQRFDVKMGLLRRAGPYLQEVDPERVVSSPVGADLLDFDRGNRLIYKPGAMAIGGALVPGNIVAMMRGFSPDVVMSFRKGMSIATMAATSFYGRRRVAWVAREGNNTMAVIDEELDNKFARAAIRRLTRTCYASADRLLTISEHLGAALVHTLGIPQQNVTTIFNPIDTDRVRQLSVQSAEVPDRPFLLGVGRLDKQKGFDTAIRAFSRSRAATTHKLVIVGRGPERSALESLAEQLRVGGQVQFTGWCDNPWSFMARAEAFLLPSRWEGFGNVVAEAMACGTPPLVSDCDFGPREIVEHDVSGVVLPVDDVAAWAQAIDALVIDRNRRRRLAAGATGRSSAFDVKTIVAAYEDLFAGVAARVIRRRGVGEPRNSPEAVRPVA